MAPKSRSQTQKTEIIPPPSKSPFSESQEPGNGGEVSHEIAAIIRSSTMRNGIIQRRTKETLLTEWQGRTPRFLFRGWKPASGGNPELNTTRAVTPHAFHGSHKEPRDKSISEIPPDQIKLGIQKHLAGQRGKSHFSSWAANFQTALIFAGVGEHAYVAVFDTSLRGKHNEIYHVPALHELGLTSYNYSEEYLVYGPVSGEAYTCVSVTQLRKQGMSMTPGSRKSTSEVTEIDLRHARKIANTFRPMGHDLGPDLFLTVFAVELSRLFHTDETHDYGLGWSQKDNRAILTHLSDAVSLSAKLSSKKPLVNPKTYVHSFPQLKAMVDILMTIELGIDRERSEMVKNASSTPKMPASSGQKRKADDSQESTDSKAGEAELQRVIPQDLCADLVRHGNAFQEGLKVTREQIDSTEAKSLALKDKFVFMKKRLEALSINPKSQTVTNAILLTKRAASDLGGLTRKTQDLTTELQHVKASLDVLEQSCNEIIESIGKEEDPLVHSDPQRSCPRSSPYQPLGRTKPKATRVFKTENNAKRTKQKGM